MATVEIDPHRCEGSGNCVRVCPAGVLAMRPLDPALPFGVRLRVLFHDGRQAHVVADAACTACMMCVAVCPGAAIVVRPETARAAPRRQREAHS